MKAIILAGGLGTRLKPFTEVIPKPLLPIGEKAVLEIQIEQLRNHGFNEIYLATNYKSDYISNFFGDGSRYGVNLQISKEKERLGTAGPIKLLESELQEPFIVINGDILCNMDLRKFYEFSLEKKGPLTIGVKKMILPFAFGNIHFDGDRVINIEEKPDITTYALAGIYIMTPEIFKFIPEGTYYGMDQLILTLLSQNKPIMKYEIQDYWLDIGRIDDYDQAQKEFQQNFYHQ